MLDWDFEKRNGDICFFTESSRAAFRMDTPEYGQFELAAADGITVRSIYASFGDGITEALALRERRKPHVAETGLEVSLDSVNPIPFGTEPKVERTFRFNGESLHVQTTFGMRHSFRMKEIGAGGLIFSGNIAKTVITDLSGKTEELDAAAIADDTTVYDDSKPPLRFAALTDAGTGLEFEIGETIWRWINAERIGGTSRFTITKRDGVFYFNWQIFTFKPETEESLPPDGRDWRIQYAIHCSGGETAAETPVFKAVFDAKDITCFSAAPALNSLKKWVRRQFADVQEGDVFAVVNAKTHICRNAAHMDRAKLKELLHWDKPALDDFSRWANRQLARYGAALVIKENAE